MPIISEEFEIAVRAGLNALPGIGGFLAAIYFGAKDEKRFKRLENALEQIKTELSNSKNLISLNNLSEIEKNRLASTLEAIFEGIDNDFTEEKIQYFKNCFFNTLTNPIVSENDYGKRKYFVSIINLLSATEIELICTLYKSKEGSAYRGKDLNYEFISWLERLKSLGLISSHLGGTIDVNIDWTSISNYKISQFGRDFVMFCLETEKNKLTNSSLVSNEKNNG